MNAADVAPSANDSLIRTALKLEPSVPPERIAEMLRALQRVPGVLLADIDASSARAVVAHDGAVPVAALVAAARAAGVDVRITGATPAADVAPGVGTVRTAVRSRLRSQQLILMGLILATMILVDILVPNAPSKHAVIDGCIIAIWAVFLAGMFRRRPS